MPVPLSSDTIAAIATAPGQGAVAIIRLSGQRSLGILQELFRPGPHYRNNALPFAFKPRTLHYGWLHSPKGEALDEVMAVHLPGPRSFSGEDCVEIHCHGGSAVPQAVLQATLEAGARLAEPGEFTRRAFLNGRLDLSQAEAVAEIIAAPTMEGVRLAGQKLQGGLADKVLAMRGDLDFLRAHLCLQLDFPDEDASESASQPESELFQEKLLRLISDVHALLDAHKRAALVREGAMLVLAGPVNAGKSSLLNAILGRERAIVSPYAGTTRDFIEEQIDLNGLPLRLVDTAGLRETPDSAEAEGVRRARELCREADLVMLVLDAAALEADRAGQAVRKAAQGLDADKTVIVLNKIDLLPEKDLERAFAVFTGLPCFGVSAKNALGLENLLSAARDKIFALHGNGNSGPCDAPAPNLRQARQLEQALAELEKLRAGAEFALPGELLSVHLDAAAEFLSAISGHSSSQDILNQVFSSFCLGK